MLKFWVKVIKSNIKCKLEWIELDTEVISTCFSFFALRYLSPLGLLFDHLHDKLYFSTCNISTRSQKFGNNTTKFPLIEPTSAFNMV